MKYVLFVCTQNAGRSQMAQAFFERHAPPDVRAESAGDAPASEIHPVVEEAMREVGIDLSDRRPKKLTLEMQLHADWAITLACGAQCPYVPTTVEDWDIADPSGRPLDDVRAIREDIETRVIDLAEHRIDDIRDDRRHRRRVAERAQKSRSNSMATRLALEPSTPLRKATTISPGTAAGPAGAAERKRRPALRGRIRRHPREHAGRRHGGQRRGRPHKPRDPPCRPCCH
jgi:arsenate reductase (thioredoxin)